jgi:aminoglycoside 6'-N-acetyltransferase
VELRRMTDADLPVLHRWLNDPGVVRWWEGEDVSWPAVVRDYGSTNRDAVEHHIAVEDGIAVGWIQCYAVADHEGEPEVRHWSRLGVRRTAAGIDYLIGEPSARHRGLGSRMIAAFVEDVVFGGHPGWTEVCASPYAANTASCRALAKAGFAVRGTFVDEAGGRCQLMVRERG